MSPITKSAHPAVLQQRELSHRMSLTPDRTNNRINNKVSTSVVGKNSSPTQAHYCSSRSSNSHQFGSQSLSKSKNGSMLQSTAVMTPIREEFEDPEDTMGRYSKGPNKPGVKRTHNGVTISPQRTPRKSIAIFSPRVSPGAVYGGDENNLRKSFQGSINKYSPKYSPSPARLSRVPSKFRTPLRDSTVNQLNKGVERGTPELGKSTIRKKVMHQEQIASLTLRKSTDLKDHSQAVKLEACSGVKKKLEPTSSSHSQKKQQIELSFRPNSYVSQTISHSSNSNRHSRLSHIKNSISRNPESEKLSKRTNPGSFKNTNKKEPFQRRSILRPSSKKSGNSYFNIFNSAQIVTQDSRPADFNRDIPKTQSQDVMSTPEYGVRLRVSSLNTNKKNSRNISPQG